MWEEEAFKDLKSNGWQWQRSRIWKPEHANLLWLLMALAYLWIISLGTHVMGIAKLLSCLTRGKSIRLSVFHLGIRYFHHSVAHNRAPTCRLGYLACAQSVV